MIHVDLFSGLGLFSYAADHVWNLEHIFCEIEDWSYRFLKQEYPNARIERDIRNFNGTEYAGRTFLLTASFPCHPISTAGKREGKNDDRWLWPQTIAITQCVQPEWVIFENVAGLTSLAEQYSASKMENKTVQRLAESDLYEKIFSQQEILSLGIIIDDIEKAGFELPKLIDGTPIVLCVPACGIGAVHRRDRVWIVANSGCGDSWKCSDTSKVFAVGNGETRSASEIGGSSGDASNPSIERSGELSESERWDDSADIDGKNQRIASNPNRLNGNNGGFGSGEVRGELRQEAGIQGCEDAADAAQQSKRKQTNKENSISNGGETRKELGNRDWYRPWPEVATELCRVDVSSTDRVHRLKALGNTIQYEIALQIMQAIESIDEQEE